MELPVASIVVVSWNTQGLLDRCLGSVPIGCPDETLEVIVVDNASSDGSQLMVKTKYPDVLLLQADTNLGYARAINRGLEHCTADYVCLLNSDTRFTRGALTKLLGYLRSQPDVGLVGPTLLHPNGSFQPSRRNFPILSRLISQLIRNRLNEPPAEPVEADWLVGACLVLPRQLLRAIGGMDESFVFYGEDMDLAYRVGIQGLKVVQLSDARVYHVGQGSSGPILNASMRVRAHYEAPLRFLRKHFSPCEILFWRVARGTIAAVRYGRARLYPSPESKQQSAIWSMVVRLCLTGKPSEWYLAADR